MVFDSQAPFELGVVAVFLGLHAPSMARIRIGQLYGGRAPFGSMPPTGPTSVPHIRPVLVLIFVLYAHSFEGFRHDITQKVPMVTRGV